MVEWLLIIGIKGIGIRALHRFGFGAISLTASSPKPA
jgi:hypothetical protein